MLPTNRRSFYRQPMWRPITIQAGGMRTGIPATLVEISGAGCKLQCRMQFRPGTAVHFELLAANGRLTLAGTILSARYLARERAFAYGVELQFTDHRAREQLLKRVHDEQIKARNTPAEERGPRIRVELRVTYGMEGSSTRFEGIATDIATGGMRLETDRVLRQEWRVRVLFSLPDRPMLPIAIEARALPGVRARGNAYVHRLRFEDVDADTARELARFIELNGTAAANP